MNISICEDKWHFIMDLYQYSTWLHLLFETKCREQMSKLTYRPRGVLALPCLSKRHVHKQIFS